MKERFIKTLNFLKDVLEESSQTSEAIDHLVNKIEQAEDSLFDLNQTMKKTTVLKPSESEFPIPEEIVEIDGGFAIFSDGACRGNPGPGSWGVMGQNAEGAVLFESSGVEVPSTNNKMELEGAIQGLELMKDHLDQLEQFQSAKVFLYSDSKYVTEGVSQWVPGWKKRGWKKADKKEPENLDLWKRLDQISEQYGDLTFIWVKGHDGHPQNEHCDLLANMALDESGF